MFMLLILALFTAVRCIPIDNSAEGEPEIECGPTSIIINFNVRNPFEGHIFVKGLFENEECRFDGIGRYTAGIELAFGTCNVARTRSLNPRGIFVTTNVVIMFHPLFLTKIDRAYHFECFYMEAPKTVSTAIEVSEMTTALQTALVPMPVCRYEILDGGPIGAPVKYALVGQQVYHKWTCETETENTFCAVVHSCTVDDGNGDTLEIINQEGCALDKYLLNNLEYPSDLMAGQEAHVYKYADREQIYYQCQISISVKEPDEACPRPQCATPQGFGARKVEKSGSGTQRLLRKKRSKETYNIVDVRIDLTTFDLIEQNNSLATSKFVQSLMEQTTQNDTICLLELPVGYAALFGILGALSVVACLLCYCLCTSCNPRNFNSFFIEFCHKFCKKLPGIYVYSIWLRIKNIFGL